jgi:hypothetical protein
MKGKFLSKERVAMILVQAYILSMVVVTNQYPAIKGVVCRNNQPVVVTTP